MKILLDTGRQRKLLILYLFVGNVAADCPIPQHGENTVLTEESLLKSEFPNGTVITYECRNGYYKVNGTGTMNCVDGKWTEPDIICSKKDCGLLEAQPHMLFNTSEGTQFGAMVKVTCDEGYVIFGSSYRKCLEIGWYGKGDCVLVTCPKLTKVENGEHSWNSDDKPVYQQTINFTCNTGYTMVGTDTIRCTETAEYDYEPPQCIVVTCPKLTQVENGEHSWNSDDKPVYQQTIHFTCNTGYTMVGTETIRCTETAEYDYEPPQCIVVTCPKPTKVENGKHSWNSDDKPGYQQTINFTCNTGYTMVGNETIRCTETAEYDYEPPQCIAYCPIPKGGENMVLTDESLLRKDFPEGTNVIYECGNGYEKESGSEIITCIGGNWTEPDLICKKISLPHHNIELGRGDSSLCRESQFSFSPGTWTSSSVGNPKLSQASLHSPSSMS
ncbi:beta-2-glycoprotein 1-like [Xiphophorus maculatus]|uniref:beta-2-glycoprotein 1-like n=1 Tax=Xiphophorus maculatus TaxID=8083 RepID=UPI000C6E6095|nr:beta-2-glycoprotein 1-like [Xiphophorus maculatus]